VVDKPSPLTFAGADESSLRIAEAELAAGRELLRAAHEIADRLERAEAPAEAARYDQSSYGGAAPDEDRTPDSTSEVRTPGDEQMSGNRTPTSEVRTSEVRTSFLTCDDENSTVDADGNLPPLAE
jgi:hypothetical protein